VIVVSGSFGRSGAYSVCKLIPQISEQRTEAGGVADRRLRDERVDHELADVLDAALALAGEPLSHLREPVGRREAHDPADR
jgi:hypothetical protein